MLHIDRNNYYGGQSASLNLNQVRRRWQQAAAEPAACVTSLLFYSVQRPWMLHCSC